MDEIQDDCRTIAGVVTAEERKQLLRWDICRTLIESARFPAECEVVVDSAQIIYDWIVKAD